MAIELTVQKREVLGKKVKKIREQDLIPAELYGRGFDNVHLSVSIKEFEQVLKEAGKSAVVNLVILNDSEESPRDPSASPQDDGGDVQDDGEIRTSGVPEDTRCPRTGVIASDSEAISVPVLIHGIQRHPVTDAILAVDFYKVRLDEEVEATVPVELIGESLAVKEKEGVLLQILSEITVKALPNAIPRSFEIDISSLVDIDQSIHVSDLKVEKDVEIINEPEAVIATIQEKMTEEEEEKLEEEAGDVSEVEVEGEKKGESEESPGDPSASPQDDKRVE